MGNLTQRNKVIVQMFNEQIANLGLEGKLAVEAITNTFTRRPLYFSYADGIPRFKVHLWDLNKLPDDELKREIANRIQQARNYYHI